MGFGREESENIFLLAIGAHYHRLIYQILFNISNCIRDSINLSLLTYLPKKENFMASKITHALNPTSQQRQEPKQTPSYFLKKRSSNTFSTSQKNYCQIEYADRQTSIRNKMNLSEGQKRFMQSHLQNDISCTRIQEKSENCESTSRELLKEDNQQQIDFIVTQNENGNNVCLQNRAYFDKETPYQRLKPDLISECRSKKSSSIQPHNEDSNKNIQGDASQDRSTGPYLVNLFDGFINQLQRKKQKPQVSISKEFPVREYQRVEKLRKQNERLVELICTQKRKNKILINKFYEYQLENEKNALKIAEMKQKVCFFQKSIELMNSQNISLRKYKQLQQMRAEKERAEYERTERQTHRQYKFSNRTFPHLNRSVGL